VVSSSLRAVLGPTSAPPTAIQYQWQRATTGSESFSDISGATGLANSPTAQDLGLSLRIQASLTNGAGLDNPALSLHSPVVQRLIEAQGNTLLSQNPISEWLSVWRGGPGASMALELTYSLPSGVSARTAESSSDGCLTPLTYRAGAHHHPDHHRKVLVNPRLTAISGKVTTTIAAAHVLSSFDAASGRALALEVPLSTARTAEIEKLFKLDHHWIINGKAAVLVMAAGNDGAAQPAYPGRFASSMASWSNRAGCTPSPT